MKTEVESYENPFGISALDVEIIHYILLLKKSIEHKLNSDIKKYKISNTQLELMASVQFRGCNTSSKLSEALNVSKANLTGLLNRLEEKKYLIRISDKEDARSKIIKLTKTGEKLVEKIVPKFLLSLNETLEVIPLKEKNLLVKNLKTIYENLPN